MKIDTQIQWFWGPFWGPFESGHAVLWPLKLNLKWGPLQIVILTPSGTQKASHLRYFFDANLMGFEDDWDKQCTEINVLFPQYFMLFQQFCFSVVGEYGWREAHLCIGATTFYALPVPLPRQVSKRLKKRVRKWGRKTWWTSGSKGTRNGPQKLSKID